MMIIIFTIFFAHAGVLITHIMDVLGIFYSAMVFGSVSLTVFTLFFKYVKLNRRGGESPYDPAMVAILTGIPKNEATAIALSSVALAPLGSGIAFLASMPPSLLPAFQVIFIILFLKLRDRVMNFYGVRREKEAIKVPVEERAKVSVKGVAEESTFEVESLAVRPGLNVLVPVDLSSDTERWVIEGLNRLSNISSVTFLYVVPLNLSEVSEFITENVIADGKKIAESKMRSLINAIRSSKIIEINNMDINYEIAVGDPASVIIDYASTGKFDLIMMGHRPHMIGSVALKVVARSPPIPVLIIRRAE
ncbi:universal stress protein [Vulcanisaeta distributa]|uniref:universal stress protein n=1 Tax=Vulcanisaeta distributa TaxID=164451 RepID=UPI000AB155D4|nr:universal stress protein [Vulcanisaeta distributa]